MYVLYMPWCNLCWFPELCGIVLSFHHYVILGIKLRLLGLHGELPYLLGHLASPRFLKFLRQTYKSMSVV